MAKKTQSSINVHKGKKHIYHKQGKRKSTLRQGPKQIATVYKRVNNRLNPRVLGEILVFLDAMRTETSLSVNTTSSDTWVMIVAWFVYVCTESEI